MKPVETIVSDVMSKLNLTHSELDVEPLDENLLDTLKDKARIAANSLRTAKSAAIDKAHAVGDAIGTDASIIRNGMLLVKGNEFVGIPEIKPDTEAAKDVMKHYPGFAIATPEQRQFAETQRVKISPADATAPWNVKADLDKYINSTIQYLNKYKSEISGRKIITASEAATVMNAINAGEKAMLTQIEKANLSPVGDVTTPSVNKTEEPIAASVAPAPNEAPASNPEQPTGQEIVNPASEPAQQTTTAPETQGSLNPQPTATTPAPSTTLDTKITNPRQPISGPDALPPAPPARNAAEEEMAANVQAAYKLLDPATKKRVLDAGKEDDFNNVTPDRYSQYESKTYSGPLDVFYN